MVDEILYLSVEGVEDEWVGAYYGGLVAIASGEVLGGDDTDFVTGLGEDEEDLGMVVGQVGIGDDLVDEDPEIQCFLGGLEVQD